jgi:tRNA A-37 threonylcarbamoyl transferase component Bud32
VRDADSTDTFAPVKTAPPDDRPPATIGKYLIVGKLGKGTQATAYRALHPVLHKELVIKYARKTLDASREERDALIREGRILADLDHPNLAKVLDLDLHDNRPFLVMEYHRGLNLEQCVAQRRLPPREAAAMIAPLARALAAAHRRGIVHQDVKPANILIDETGKPFVLDFGLARLRDAWSTAADQPDGGTVAYMAPEQARGDAAKIGPASDVFSLGAVLYFLLTGNPPFRAGDWYATMKQAGRCEFDAGALRGKGIPPRLAAICLRAMAAEPDQRYRRAEDMASDLERYLRRPRKLLVLAAAASLLLAAVALWHFWPAASGSVEQAQAPVHQLLITGIGRTEKGEPQRHPIGAMKDLTTYAPLKRGDIVTFGFEVPHGFQSSLFFVNAAGEVRELEPLQVHTVGATDRVRFPAKGDWQLDDPPGPVLFLACASRNAKPSLDEVRRLVQNDGAKATPLPVPEEKKYLFSFNRVEPLEESRGAIETPYSQLRDRLERLRAMAADKYDFVWGVALPMR